MSHWDYYTPKNNDGIIRDAILMDSGFAEQISKGVLRLC